MVVGRLTKEMKKAELMEQLTEANETYLEKISQHMECQYREMQRVERRIERKKKLIDKKYIVSIVINKCVVKFGGKHDRKRLNSSENAVWGFYGIKLRP